MPRHVTIQMPNNETCFEVQKSDTESKQPLHICRPTEIVLQIAIQIFMDRQANDTGKLAVASCSKIIYHSPFTKISFFIRRKVVK
jgi:hypothetical protein